MASSATAPRPERARQSSLVEAVLRRERALALAALVTSVLLAWAWLLQGAGMGMSALDMTDWTLFPHRHPEVAGSMGASWVVAIAMWWVMMVGMMAPSAAPLVLLYLRVLHAQPGGGRVVARSTMGLVAGYLAVWLAFSVAAAGLQRGLQSAGWLSGMMLWSTRAGWSATVLALAGVYQLTPWKRACLAHCRSPVAFLVRHGRPGLRASLLLGLRHGAWCVGCCWLLMALLFVGGVMNLTWIAALTALVLVERLLPAGDAVGRGLGGALVAWAVATLLV